MLSDIIKLSINERSVVMYDIQIGDTISTIDGRVIKVKHMSNTYIHGVDMVSGEELIINKLYLIERIKGVYYG